MDTSEETPNSSRSAELPCPICDAPATTAARGMPVRAIRPSLQAFLEERYSGVLAGRHVCRKCLARLTTDYQMDRLARERGDLSAIEREVASKSVRHIALAENLAASFERSVTPGQHVADWVARIGGSWGFVISFLVVLGSWMLVNAAVLRNGAFDPYPFILLNLVLSSIAALQAPIIMMSQNRSAARDRMQADQDFRINLKAEIEIAALHEKVDHLLHAQWEQLIEMQVTQLELLGDLTARKSEPTTQIAS